VADAGLTHGVWLERVPDLVAECVEEWGLRLGEPYVGGAAGHAHRVELSDSTLGVLKVWFPHRESEHEPDALALWNGEGAVRLLAHDPSRSALLIERCEPGSTLSAIGAEPALDVLIELLPRLWKRAGSPFGSLSDEAEWWVEYLPSEWERVGRPFERRILDAASSALVELAGTQGEQVLVNQDLHGDNVLAAQREPWLVIDPTPLIGEREFALAPIIRSDELGENRADALYRLDRLTSELGLDKERARWWTIGQTLAWSTDSLARHPQHLELVRWLLDDAE
jgi:streptomycin 6-kinase